MRRTAVIGLTLLFVAALLSFSVTYSVRFTEAAVLTTFGKAGEGDVQREPGLRFKWPYPVQSVIKYDTRVRFVQLQIETQQTADKRQITVEAFCTWRVSDPLKFFRRFGSAGERAADHYSKAEEQLKAALRSAISLTSRYRMDELFNAEAGSKLPELEGAIFSTLSSSQAGASLGDLGIEPVGVGISRILLPEATTQSVFTAMETSRDRLASSLTSQGDALAQQIKSGAEKDVERIMSFARLRAEQIRVQGDTEAAQYLKQMDANAELAVFLREMDFVREAFGKRTTLVLSGDMPGMWAFFPDALARLKAGEIPPLTRPAGEGGGASADGGGHP